MKFKSFLDPLPRTVAHRGDSKNYPENTLEAFLSAARMGVDVIETDVHLTKDGNLVIWHDPTLERNTDGTGRIEDHTLEELKKLDAGYTFTPDGGKTFPYRGKGVKLCTLDEALMALPEQRFNVDLKSEEENIADVFISVLKKNNAENRVCAASFHLNNLKNVRKKDKNILTSITTLEVIPKVIFRSFYSKNRTTPPVVFQIPEKAGVLKIVTPPFIKKWKEKGAVIMVWTINEKADMIRLFEMGVDSVMTDDPKTLLEVVKELKLD